MTVINPGALGLIVRRSERTRAYVDGCIQRFAEANPHMSVFDYARHLNVDEDLFATSVAMNGLDLESAMQELERQGCIRGLDFVPTNSVDGVIGDFPRTKTYRLKPGA
jgi:hypothetical protein